MTTADTSVQGAVAHVATAAGQAATAQAEVRTAIPLTIPPATGHLKIADSELTKVQTELAATRSDLMDTLTNLAVAATNLTNETARADNAEKRYKDQWLAGKSWAVIWSLAIGLGLLLIAAALLNFYTDIFVIPIKLFASWVAHVFGGTVKAMRDLVVGVWDEVMSLFRKKAVVIPPGTPITLDPATIEKMKSGGLL